MDASTRPVFVLLIGVNGAGKTVLSRRLAAALPSAHVECDERAFRRRFIVPDERKGAHDLNEAILKDCREIVDGWPPGADPVIIDRWFETYVECAGLPRDFVAEIERYIRSRGYTGLIVNLWIDPAQMAQRLAHMKRHRLPEWWVEELGPIEDRARRDCISQVRDREFCEASIFQSAHIETTAMEWDAYLSIILKRIDWMRETRRR
ncbi:MAG: AAA family ATPase [Rhodospirillaceae bacterium]